MNAPGDAARRREIETAVLETVLYSDLFDYPLTYAEIAQYLIGVRADVDSVRASLDAPRYLNGYLHQSGSYVFARQRESIVERRRARRVSSARLWASARRFVRVLSVLPFVRMVGVTGALAMDNSEPGDDIDVMVVAARRRAWTARLFAVALVYAGKLFGHTLCPNYVITEDALELEPRDLFAAHEFAQMAPLYGFAVYERLRQANRWVFEFLPNASTPLCTEREIRLGALGWAIKRAGERLLGGRLGDALEEWEMRRKQRKFAPRMTAGSRAILDRDRVKGHFEDYGAPAMALYAARLVQFPMPDAEDA